MAKAKKAKPQTRNPIRAVLRSPIFKQKGHGVNAKHYDRKRLPGTNPAGDYFCAVL